MHNYQGRSIAYDFWQWFKMKPMIMDLPIVGADNLKQNPASYTRLVLNGMTKAEKIVKVACWVCVYVCVVSNRKRQVEDYCTIHDGVVMVEVIVVAIVV